MIVLNDNGRSYAPTVSRSRLSRGRGRRRPSGGRRPSSSALGIAYLGPVDGHDLAALETALRRAAADRSVRSCSTCITMKGLGYGPAEADAEKRLHDVSPFDPATGRATAAPGRRGAATPRPSAGRSWPRRRRRPELVAVTAAMGGPTGLLPFAERFPDRFFDVGIAEQHAVTAAAGMAMAGLRPVVAIYSTFLNRAWDQVYYDVGLHRLPVVFCLDRAGITGDDGPSHHGLLDLALLTKVPGMTVLAPSSYEEVAEMLATRPRHRQRPGGHPLAEDRGPAGRPDGSGPAGRRVVRRGPTSVSSGWASCWPPARRRPTSWPVAGVSARRVWDARVVAPLDPAMLADAGRHPVVLVAEDGVAEGGVAALVRSALEHPGGGAGDGSPMVVGCGVPLVHVPHGRADDLLAGFGLDGPGLADAALFARRRSGLGPAA